MTAERNTIYDLVSDLEDEICNMEGYASLMQLAADGVASHHSAEAGDGLIRLATETNACVRRLREWHRIAHAAVGGQDDAEPVKPAEPADTGGNARMPLPDDPEARWRQLYSRWLEIRAEWSADVVEEPRTEQLAREETEIMLAMAATPVSHRWLEQKLEVLDSVMFHDSSSSWIDRRDELLLNSIKADVKALD